jgi:hypothetical protein
MGFQLIHWPDELCRLLAAEGFRVVRFDNRDAAARRTCPDTHTLEDMGDDAAGLLGALGIERAHVVGASLAGWCPSSWRSGIPTGWWNPRDPTAADTRTRRSIASFSVRGRPGEGVSEHRQPRAARSSATGRRHDRREGEDPRRWVR